ncbi:hypothetical protein [Flavivirga eckloniae]|uniref:Uncharacterized protein n=1 Tax=Flavivirga eckloniae TaxID=1803846 RepID=A0A2K9PW47_9FLAO|nr:hypothetical protein [Flavivirga eckloniae]AUP81295.1 hypothetical protein C1H87_22270 [Flavivirga eckloniae]
MTIIDFLIGMTLMNAMLHLALGFWKGRMLTSFGYGNTQNIAYGILNIAISLGLFIYKYGINEILNNGIFGGALTVFLIFLIFGKFLYRVFNKKE